MVNMLATPFALILSRFRNGLQTRLTKRRNTAHLQSCFLSDSVGPKTSFSCSQACPKEDIFSG